MLPLAAIAGLLLAEPFQDLQNRFSVELPAGWVFAPQPGDTKGVSFHRDRDGIPANVRVHISDGAEEAALPQLAKEVCASAKMQPGYRLLSEAATQLAEYAARRCRYVQALAADKRTKMSEDVILVVGSRGYVLHFETLAEAFGVFEDDFAAFAASFRPKGAGAPKGDAGAKLVGRWQLEGNPDVVLELSADGIFELAGTRGRYEAAATTLWLRPNAGGQERFAWRLEGNALVLSNSNLPDGARYVRIGLSGQDLIGVWTAKDYRLDIRQGGRLMWNDTNGNYSLHGDRISIRLGNAEHVFTVEVGQGTLVLRGDLFGPAGRTFSGPARNNPSR